MAKTIITLGREYCTGGRYIAEDVANALGIKLYDKELITMAAKHSGLSEEAVAASEKRHTHSLLYSLYTMGNELPLGDQVFILQSRIIKQLAEEGPCVILGRCGDYVQHGVILHVGVFANGQSAVVAAQHGPVPHRGTGFQDHIALHGGVGRYKSSPLVAGNFSTKGQKHC